MYEVRWHNGFKWQRGLYTAREFLSVYPYLRRHYAGVTSKFRHDVNPTEGF